MAAKDEAVQLLIQLGHTCNLRDAPTAENFTHDWCVFVRGDANNDISHCVQKVVFNLHPEFKNHRRVLKEPPYEVSESGYGSFFMNIEVHFKNPREPKFASFDYDLALRDTKTPVSYFRPERLVFQRPVGDFRDKLFRSGGFPVTVQHEGERFKKGGKTVRSQAVVREKSAGSADVKKTPDKVQQKGKKIEGNLEGKSKLNVTPSKTLNPDASFTAIFGEPLLASAMQPKEAQKPKSDAPRMQKPPSPVDPPEKGPSSDSKKEDSDKRKSVESVLVPSLKKLKPDGNNEMKNSGESEVKPEEKSAVGGSVSKKKRKKDRKKEKKQEEPKEKAPVGEKVEEGKMPLKNVSSLSEMWSSSELESPPLKKANKEEKRKEAVKVDPKLLMLSPVSPLSETPFSSEANTPVRTKATCLPEGAKRNLFPHETIGGESELEPKNPVALEKAILRLEEDRRNEEEKAKAKKIEEETARKREEEKAKLAREKAEIKKEDKAKLLAQEKAKRMEEERAMLLAQEKPRVMEVEKAKQLAQEKVNKAEEEKAKLLLQDRAKKQDEEKANLEQRKGKKVKGAIKEETAQSKSGKKKKIKNKEEGKCKEMDEKARKLEEDSRRAEEEKAKKLAKEKAKLLEEEQRRKLVEEKVRAATAEDTQKLQEKKVKKKRRKASSRNHQKPPDEDIEPLQFLGACSSAASHLESIPAVSEKPAGSSEKKAEKANEIVSKLAAEEEERRRRIEEKARKAAENELRKEEEKRKEKKAAAQSHGEDSGNSGLEFQYLDSPPSSASVCFPGSFSPESVPFSGERPIHPIPVAAVAPTLRTAPSFASKDDELDDEEEIERAKQDVENDLIMKCFSMTDKYRDRLVELGKIISELSINGDYDTLQRVVDVIEESGQYRVSRENLHFNLLFFDESVIQKLDCMLTGRASGVR